MWVANANLLLSIRRSYETQIIEKQKGTRYCISFLILQTGRSKHYAFVEFLDPVVAQIVADTMDGHIMFTKMLQCKVIPPEKVHAKMFKGHGERLQIGRLRQKNQQASSQVCTPLCQINDKRVPET